MNKYYKRKLIIHIHGFETRQQGFNKYLLKKILNTDVNVVVPSKYIQNKVKIIYNKDASILRNPLPDRDEIDNRKYSIIIASHTENKKIIESIDKFFKKYKDSSHYLVIITPYGHKNYLNKLKKHINNISSKRIELLNYYFRSIEDGITLHRIFSGAEEVILDSEEEGLNVILTEAKLLDKKLWVSDIPPNNEIKKTNLEEFSKTNVKKQINEIMMR
ncbi:MAG: hypothetical protein QCI00_01675 [Candidatus Thermoplasmatota archaeon]|nr:hypothetical protein [Candidatus Thermoplasmatota archaeon]